MRNMTDFSMYLVSTSSPQLFRRVIAVVLGLYYVYKQNIKDLKGFGAVDVSEHVMWDVKHKL